MTKFILWGLTASPYQLKMQALLDASGMDWVRWPQQASRRQALAANWRLRRAVANRRVQRFGQMDRELDEYPAVPYYSLDGRQFYFDSSALADHLDTLGQSRAPLVPADPAEAFICRLVDEAFDEFGLYMVHHMRWVGSARSTTMGNFTARELRTLLPPGLPALVARRLYRRQSQRCPYLFSVAPEGFSAGVPAARTPPSRPGFPPTHELLETAWARYLQVLEALLSSQPWVLGQRFSLADAAIYGQLGMNLVDPEAIELLAAMAPRVHEWLQGIHRGEHAGSDGATCLSPDLAPLLQLIGETFVPLMVQNSMAYEEARQRGETLFNEAAFDAGRALYDGQLLGFPFRAVVKTFQVRVWRDLCSQWQALGDADRARMLPLLPDSVVQALGD